jgi:hypothetical protein
MDGEHVGLFDGARIDALLRLDRGQRGEAITVQRRGLEFELGRSLSISPASSCFTRWLRPDRKSFASRTSSV